MPRAAALTRVLEEAEDIARATGRRTNTAHVLLALFTVPNQAERLLAERGINEDRLLDLLPDHPRESAEALDEVLERASQVAAGCGAREVQCLHLLVAMTRARHSIATDLLAATGVALATLRTRALTVLTGAMPRWLDAASGSISTPTRMPESRTAAEALSRVSVSPRKVDRARRDEEAHSTFGRAEKRSAATPRAGRKAALDWSPPLVQPKLSRRSALGAETTRRANEARDRKRARADELEAEALETPSVYPEPSRANVDRVPSGSPALGRGPSSPHDSSQARAGSTTGGAAASRPGGAAASRPGGAAASRPAGAGASSSAGGAAGSTLFQPNAPAFEDDLGDEPILDESALLEEDDGRADDALASADPRTLGTSDVSSLVFEDSASALPERSRGRSRLPLKNLDAWRLSAAEYPWLTSLGRNLSLEAISGELDRLVGREKEVEELIDILGKRRANNPCLIGEPGVGKTAVVEGLAQRLAAHDSPPQLRDRIIIALDVGALLVGTHLRGSFSEKLQGLKEEVKRSGGRVIVFFDELHTLVGAGSTGDGPQDAANELKTALARGDFPCIGATTRDEFVRHIEPDAALRRRFYPVLVREPSREDALAMLAEIMPAYAAHHRVVYQPDALAAAVNLSSRYITDRHLPDKAIALLDLAGSRAARGGQKTVGAQRVAALVAEQTDLPVERLLASDHERLLTLESHLAREIVGHEKQLARIAEVVRRNAAGFSSRRPQGVFLFLGPTGVGKTETAKALAKVLHGSEDMMIRFDLSEFAEAHTVARLVGAPPGYVGHDAGGQLTEAVRRRPGRIVLFDEIEKAHREVLQVLLQILDEGRLTDGRGQTVSFAETIVIMTSNLGSDLANQRRPIGFSSHADDAALERAILDRARAEMPPELWSRIEERLVFAPLSREELRRIAHLLAADSSRRLERERGIRYTLDDTAIDYLLDQGGADALLGARPMRQILARIVEAPIASRILEGRIHADEHVLVSTRPNGGLAFLVGDDRTPLSQRPRPA